MDSFITDTVCDCFVELCASYGVAVQASDCSLPAPDIASVLGFTGSQLRGSLAISTTRGFLARTRPVPSESDLEIRDWGAELVNQLVGRVKNRMVEYGVDLRLSTPVSILGADLHVMFDDRGSSREALWFSSPPGHVAVLVDVVVEPGVEFKRLPEHGSSIAEGDFVAF